jgi:hypothetical protein
MPVSFLLSKINMRLFGVKKVDDPGQSTIFDAETRAVLFLALCIILFVVTLAIYNKMRSTHLLFLGLLTIFGVGIYFSAIRFDKLRKTTEASLLTNASDERIQLKTCPSYWQRRVNGQDITCVGKIDANTVINPQIIPGSDPNTYYPQEIDLTTLNIRNNQALCESAKQHSWPEAYSKCP